MAGKTDGALQLCAVQLCAIQSVSEHQPSTFILATCACSHAAGKSKMLRVTSTRFEKHHYTARKEK
jgi:hypothetical protein